MKIPTCIYCFLLLFCWQTNSLAQEIQRVRLNFNTPTNMNRDLLLAFTPNNEATDGFDWGYDGGTPMDWPDDLNWLIGESRCVIQGVGSFSVLKTYPFWLNLSNEGTSTISLTELENFEEEINVYIYDSHEDTYTMINDTPLEINLSPDLYIERYYIAFQVPDERLDTEPVTRQEIDIVYYQRTRRLKIKHDQNTRIHSLEIFNAIGQSLMFKNVNDEWDFDISLPFAENEVLLAKVSTDQGYVVKRILL